MAIESFMDQLRRELSSKDLERMMTWMAGMPPERSTALMKFIAARETLAPAVGEPAPDFDLPMLGRGERVRLSDFRGRRPVALIFGSYT